MIRSLFNEHKSILFTASIYMVGVTLPWSVSVNGFFLILSAFFLLFHISGVQWKDLTPSDWYYILIFLLLFLIHVASLTYTENIKKGLTSLEKKWVFILLPTCVLVASNFGLNRSKLLQFFSYSVVAATIIALILAFVNNYHYNQEHDLRITSFNHWFYSYKLLSENIGIHPAYLSCFVSLVIFFFLTQIFTEAGRQKNLLRGIAVIYLLFYLTLLSSRNILVTTLILIFFVGIIYVLYTRRIKLLIIGTLIYSLIFIGIFSNEITRSRIVAIFDYGKTDSQWGSISVRFQEWDSSLKIFKQDKLLGTGPGDLRDELVKEYESKGWTNMAEERFNSHNQFIETLGGLGILGFIILTTMFALSIRRALIKHDLLFLTFLTTFIMFSLTESTLEVQKGIVFFTLFNSVFYFSKPSLVKKIDT